MTSLRVPLEDHAELLATRWMSVKEFEEAGEVSFFSFQDESELHAIYQEFLVARASSPKRKPKKSMTQSRPTRRCVGGSRLVIYLF